MTDELSVCCHIKLSVNLPETLYFYVLLSAQTSTERICQVLLEGHREDRWAHQGCQIPRRGTGQGIKSQKG